MRDTANICRMLTAAMLIASVATGTAHSAAAQSAAAATSWQALAGCWEPVATARDASPDSARGHLVCIVPVAGSTSAVDMFTVADAKVVEQERVDASGTRQPLTRDDCSGWQTAEWSATGQRLYLRSELTCEGGLKRTSSGVISMPTPGEWVDVQSVGVGERKAVRSLRYRAARSYAAIPVELSQAIGARPFSVGVNTARMAAASPVTHADLVDVSRHLDAAATEVWLVEQELAFTADAKALVRLADAGIPGSVIDVVVAMSYPEAFSLASPTVAGGAGPARALDPFASVGRGGYDPYWDPYYGSRYDYNRRYYSPYGFSQYGSAYGYGSGWYPSQRPVIIVVGTPDPNAEPAPTRADGKVVKGSGYTRRPTSTPTADRERSSGSSSGGSSSAGSSSAGSSSSGSSSTGSSGSAGSSGSSSGERTAKRRPPPSGSN